MTARWAGSSSPRSASGCSMHAMKTVKSAIYWTFIVIGGLILSIPMLFLLLGFFASPYRG